MYLMMTILRLEKFNGGIVNYSNQSEIVLSWWTWRWLDTFKLDMKAKMAITSVGVLLSSEENYFRTYSTVLGSPSMIKWKETCFRDVHFVRSHFYTDLVPDGGAKEGANPSSRRSMDPSHGEMVNRGGTKDVFLLPLRYIIIKMNV